MRASYWSPTEIRFLRVLWNEGLPARKIGREIGRTGNSVIGKAHRLGLDARPSPIKRGDQPRA